MSTYYKVDNRILSEPEYEAERNWIWGFWLFIIGAFAERTGWVSSDDGMLAIDLNTNGIIDNGGELFGNAATAGLSALAVYDTNLDGVITAADAAFSSLVVWVGAANDNEEFAEHCAARLIGERLVA